MPDIREKNTKLKGKNLLQLNLERKMCNNRTLNHLNYSRIRIVYESQVEVNSTVMMPALPMDNEPLINIKGFPSHPHLDTIFAPE